jgi:phage gpG-like protein
MDKDLQAQIDAFKKKMLEKQGQVHSKLGEAIAQACNDVQTTAVEGMTNTEIDTSKRYKRGKNIYHSPSMEGAYPAVDTGMLRRSITHTVEYGDDGEVIGKVGTNLKYGKYLEFGTSRGLRPRPWLKPSLVENEENIKKRIQDAVKDGMK